MTATTSKNGFRVVNEFHGFDRFTTSERQVKKLVRDSRPSTCKSRTYIYRITNGETIGRVDFDVDRLRDL